MNSPKRSGSVTFSELWPTSCMLCGKSRITNYTFSRKNADRQTDGLTENEPEDFLRNKDQKCKKLFCCLHDIYLIRRS